MSGQPLCQFTAAQPARSLAKAIEAYAEERRVLTVLVVPWESDDTVVTMAVTSVKADGWAIEHTNLGTIKLVNLDGGRARVTFISLDQGDTGNEPVPAVLERFARGVCERFQIANV